MITVDVVTPYRRIVERVSVDNVVVPSVKGELQILPGHTDLLTMLEPGVLAFTHQGKKRVFAVSFGFLEVRNDKVMVLAETCEEAHEIDKARALAAQKKAEAALSAALTEESFKKYQFKLQRAITRQGI